jgi:hypothetical protein
MRGRCWDKRVVFDDFTIANQVAFVEGADEVSGQLLRRVHSWAGGHPCALPGREGA